MAYWLSKILPLAVLPLGFSLILLLVGLIGRWRWPVITAVVLLWLLSLGLVSQTLWRWLEKPWHRQSVAKAASADAIVALSGGRHPAPGTERVASLLEGPDPCLACFITRMEVLYRVWKDEVESSGRLAYEHLQSLPIQWVDQTEPLLLEASRIRVSHPLPFLMSGSLPRRS